MNAGQVIEVQPSTSQTRSGPGRAGRRRGVFIALAVIGVAGIGIALKIRGASPGTDAQEIPTVAAARVTRESLSNEVPIPAEFRPYVQSELHAMVTGYVAQMNVDIGDRVTKGEVLATIEVPELRDELRNAQAREQQAEADYADAHLIYTRLQEVNAQHPKLVAQQDIDTAQSKDASANAARAAAHADVEKYQTLVNYTNIMAPFDGIITKREADPGALVQAGTSSDRSMPLVRVSDNYRLRLDFPVSVDYVHDVHVGDTVSIRVDSLGGKTFAGRITRSTGNVNDETRTMETEMEVDNPNLEIVPGMYAIALFKFETHANALAIPTQALADPKDPNVWVIGADGIIQRRPIKIGIETPDKYEVTSGVQEGDLVMIGNATEVHAGQKVEAKVVQ